MCGTLTLGPNNNVCFNSHVHTKKFIIIKSNNDSCTKMFVFYVKNPCLCLSYSCVITFTFISPVWLLQRIVPQQMRQNPKTLKAKAHRKQK